MSTNLLLIPTNLLLKSQTSYLLLRVSHVYLRDHLCKYLHVQYVCTCVMITCLLACLLHAYLRRMHYRKIIVTTRWNNNIIRRQSTLICGSTHGEEPQLRFQKYQVRLEESISDCFNCTLVVTRCSSTTTSLQLKKSYALCVEALAGYACHWGESQPDPRLDTHLSPLCRRTHVLFVCVLTRLIHTYLCC